MYFRKIQSILQKDNVDQYRALHEERRRAEDATEKAKEVIKVRSNVQYLYAPFEAYRKSSLVSSKEYVYFATFNFYLCHHSQVRFPTWPTDLYNTGSRVREAKLWSINNMYAQP